MYASGSTWLFNAARAVAAEVQPAMPHRAIYLETLPHLARLPPGPVVVKSHHLTPRLAQFVDTRSSRILLSVRDPRDSVTSLMQHMGHSFPHALCLVERSALFCGRYASHERRTLFIYEQAFTELPETFDRLANAFGGSLALTVRERLFTNTRRNIIENRIARLEDSPTKWRNPANGDLVDTDTQWHTHHAGRNGEMGRWQCFLRREEIRQIEGRLVAFMNNFGYKT
jgi:hypothetical protein